MLRLLLALNKHARCEGWCLYVQSASKTTSARAAGIGAETEVKRKKLKGSGDAGEKKTKRLCEMEGHRRSKWAQRKRSGEGGGLEVCGCKLWLQAVVAQQKGEEVKEKKSGCFGGGGGEGWQQSPAGLMYEWVVREAARIVRLSKRA